jgi:hypothetical protein
MDLFDDVESLINKIISQVNKNNILNNASDADTMSDYADILEVKNKLNLLLTKHFIIKN